LDLKPPGGAIFWGESMAPGQAAEEWLRLLRVAVGLRRPIAAVYEERRRLLCPHRLGWNREGQRRVLCYQYGGASVSGLELRGAQSNWRCLAVDKLLQVELLQDSWHTAPNHSGPQTCIAQVEMDVEDQPEDAPQKGP
jgi:hypothetical protein